MIMMTGVKLHTGRMSTHKRAVVYILLYLGDIYIQYDKYKLYIIYSIGFCWKTDRRFFSSREVEEVRSPRAMQARLPML